MKASIDVVKRLTLVLVLASCSMWSFSQAQGEKTFGDYTVYHTAFNSMFLKPDIAAAYGLARGEDLFLVNISVNAKNTMYGQRAAVSGNIRNLLQQQKQLEFQEIDEGEAVYYMAPVRVRGEDVLHFAIDVQVDDAEPFTLNFTHKLASE